MSDIKEIRLFFLRHGYLLIVAAWLFTFAFLFSNYWSYYSSPQGVKRSLERSLHNRELAFEELANDTIAMRHLFQRSYSEAELKRLHSKDYYIYAYDSSSTGRWLLFWSTNLVQPDEQMALKEGSAFVKLKNGYYEVLCRRLPSAKPGHIRYLVGLIPVMLEYSISNDYLVDHFFDKPVLGKEYRIHLRPPGIPVLNNRNIILFYLHYDPALNARPPNLLSVILRVLGCICVLIFLNLFATLLARQKTPLIGFLYLLFMVTLLRVLTYLYPFPFNLRALNIFMPYIYAKDEIFHSLGDLLLNVLLAFWMLLFFREHVKTINAPALKYKWQSWLVIALASLVMFLVGQFLSELIQSLVIDSKISFDVTNFFSLNEYSVIGFIILGFIAFSFLFFSQIINFLLNELTQSRHRTKYIFLGAVGVVWLLFRIHNPELPYFTVMVVWLLLYVMLLDTFTTRFKDNLGTVSFVFWLVLLTITTSAVLVYYNNKKELSQRERLAINLSKQRDPYLEMLLNDVNHSNDDDELMHFFFQENRSSSQLPREMLENELRQKYFKGYLSRFNIDFYFFDENGSPVYSLDTANLDSLYPRLLEQSEQVGNDNDLFYKESSYNHYSYIGIKVFRKDSITLGTIMYELTPAVVNPQKLYPELLVDGELSDPEKESAATYSYAIYDKGILVSNNNDFPFPIKLYNSDIPQTDVSEKTVNRHSMLVYKASRDKIVMVVKESRSFIEFITLFAYMFCLFLLIIVIYRLLDLLVKARMRIGPLRALVDVSIRKKVHGTVIFVVVFAFIILGVTTILFFINRSETENRERLSKTMNEIAHDVENEFYTQRTFDELEDLYDPVFQAGMQSAISQIAEDRALDINIYDRDGNLEVSTQPLMTEKGLLSRKMHPTAYFHMFRMNRIQFIQEEKIGTMRYLSGYVPLRNKEGEVFAYLNVPYFATQTELNQQISNFLVALINFNAFIFLIAGMLALLITNSITKSFSLVTEKLRHVNLGQRNDEIEWDKDDEIGALVKEYNKMVRKLEVSAAKLAKSEREGAWREMARQVAHEIKNPLTPMKLSIQYLQRAIGNDSPNVKELTNNVAHTLVEQIEHLSNIASDFSAFSRIGEAVNEVLLLNETIHSLHALYQGQPGCDISYHEPDQPYYVFADKTQMNRLFTNLLQNAIQAIPESRSGHIVMHMEATENKEYVIVSIRDNGEGISPEIQSRIFVPNFTTKNSGTGLGLAMCKNIVEQARGEIWFETRIGMGTTFFVKLPLLPQVL
ncbi:MAG TPA: HAMP domain-containing sensor histidine kinase [Chitinophaga sp.]|uniref:sensor histidine kinase n=1 Tax=Chitinophaga sp. TaxID=1869181 RepID=UPI002DB56CB9|nr:HAMP domain-containing sensor histidine kinase [Chitinophaga sp.]HEU4555106.1 HAMP domain-containing sensor histidine kinase [Chitinophaga sp.]